MAVFAVCYAAPKPQSVVIDADPFSARIATGAHLANIYPQFNDYSGNFTTYIFI